MEHSAFPSDETLAAFIDGQLDEETRKRVVAHVAVCEDCYGTVMASRSFQGAEEKPVTLSHPRSWKALWISSGSIAAAAVIALVIFAVPLRDWYDEYSYNRRTHIGTLLDAANRLPFRPSEARLSGQSVYRPAEPVKRGTKEESHPLRLLAAASAAEEETQSAPAVIKLHTAGVSSLMLGRVDAAVEQLDQALRQNPDIPLTTAIHSSTDSRLLNDAAAAHYTRFKVRASAEDLPISYEAVARAWTLRQDSSTAWNRALILQAMELHDSAIAAWRDYIVIDDTSSWSNEARKHLKELTSGQPSSSAFDGSKVRELALSDRQEELIAVARSRPQDIRSFCEEEVLPVWARALLANDTTRAARELAIAQSIALAIRQTAQDDLDIETVTLIQHEKSSERRAALARAVTAFADGRMLSRQHHTSEALAKLNDATALLRSLSCPLWLRSQVYVGTSDYYLGAYAPSAEEIRQIREAVGNSADRYPSVMAQAEWIHGLLETTANHPYEAVRACRIAARHFEATGERDNAAFLQLLTSEALALTGDVNDSWAAAIAALRIGHGYSTARHLALITSTIGRAALASRYAATADEYARASLTGNLRVLDPPFVADALMLRGRTLEVLGAPARAELCWNAVTDIAKKLPDASLRNRMQADVAFARASSWQTTSSEELDRAIDSCRQDGDQLRLARLSFARGGRNVHAGAVAAAVADYDTAMEALSRVDASNIAGIRTWREGMRESLDEAIRFAIENGRDQDALRWLTLIRSHAPVSHPPNEQTAAIVYWALSGRICTWVIQPSNIFFHVEPFSRASLERLAGDARQDQGSAAELYDKLLRPIDSHLGKSTNLLIFADEFFTGVPFSALYDRVSREYAVQRYDVRLARTISLTPAPDLERPWVPLIVADPAFDGTIFPDLPRLDGAIREAKAISGLFPQSALLSGEAATLAAMERAVSPFGVLHICAHAIAGDGAREPSAVVLAPDALRSGLLYAGDIRRDIFGRLQLVVISACRSATNRTGDISDIVEAFLAAGVPNVIGSVSDVADSQSAAFYSDFYRTLLVTHDPAAAFRTAQLDGVRRRSPVWKNYVMFTAYWPATGREEIR